MRLTIAFDDISLPLPKMRRPDVRQRVIEAVLDLAAEAGVDDVHLICALALHRRMTEAELRHAVGDRVTTPSRPRDALPARRRGPRQPRLPRHDRARRGGRDQQAGRRRRTCSSTSTSTSSRWTAGGSRRPPAWPATASLRHHHNPTTMEASHSFMDQHRSELHKSNWRMGKVLVDSGVKVFQIETTLNTDTFPPAVRVPVQAGVGVDGQGPGDVPRHGQVAVAGPDPAGPQDPPLDRGAAPDDERAGRRRRGRAPVDDRARLRASTSSRSRARPTS